MLQRNPNPNPNPKSTGLLNRIKLKHLMDSLRAILLSTESEEYREDAYVRALVFLNDIITMFYTNKGTVDKDKLAKLNHSKSWTHYHQIQHKLHLINELIITQTDANRLAGIFDIKCNEFINSGVADESKGFATLDEIAFNFKKLFAGGISEIICRAANGDVGEQSENQSNSEELPPRAPNMDKSVNMRANAVAEAANESNLDKIVDNSVKATESIRKKLNSKRKELFDYKDDKTIGDAVEGFVKKLSSEDSPYIIGKEKIKAEVKRFELLLRAFKVSANEGIKLVKLETLYNEEHDKVKINQLTTTIDSAFKDFIEVELKSVGLTISRMYREETDFYKNIYRDLEKILNQKNPKNDKKIQEQQRVAKLLKVNILKFHQANAIPPDFGVMNPALVLNPEIPYSSLCSTLGEQLQNFDFASIQQKFSVLKEKSIFDKFFDKINGREDSHAESARKRILISNNLLAHIGQFQNPTLHDFTELCYALNQAAFNDGGFTDVVKKRKSALFRSTAQMSGKFVSAQSPVRAAVLESLSIIKQHLYSDDAQVAKTLLGTGIHGNLHDLYFELNYAQNLIVKEEMEKKYSVINSFPRTLLNIFGKPELETERVDKLSKLMDHLVACKTEEEYLAFFVEANGLLVNSGNMRWDSLYKDTVRKAMRAVLNNHILLPGKLKLNFSTEQLELVLKLFKANKMGKEDLTAQLEQIVNDRKQIESSIPDEKRLSEAKAEIENIDKERVQDQEQAKRQANQRKLNAFRITLLNKLETNILADLVISTGRFKINMRDIGIVAAKLSSLISLSQLPGASTAGSAFQQVAEGYDIKRQLAEADVTAELAAQFGGSQMFFNEIIKTVVKELCSMFETQIYEMKEGYPERFAEFCFNRIYQGLKMTPKQRIDLIDLANQRDLDIRDFLLASVFLVPKDLNSIPFRRDHYNKVGDDRWFTDTTFQGLVGNVGFYIVEPEELEQQSIAPLPVPRAPEGQAVDVIEAKAPVLQVGQVEAIEAKAPAVQAGQVEAIEVKAPVAQSSTAKINKGFKPKKIYVDMESIEDISSTGGLNKYKSIKVQNENLANVLSRNWFDEKNRKVGECTVSPEQIAVIKNSVPGGMS